MYMNEQTNEISTDLPLFITSIVDENWSKTSAALLLSQLGGLINRGGFSLHNELKGRKLADYLSKELSSQVKVIRSTKVDARVGVLPSRIAVGEDVEGYFKPSSNPYSPPARIPHLPPPLWAAFTRPLAHGQVRIVNLEPRISFQDEPISTTTSNEHKLTIDEANLVDRTSTPDYQQQVFASIQSWLLKNKLTLESLIENANRQRGSEPTVSIVNENLMTQLLAKLTIEEQRRTQLPLDVIARLLK